MTTGARLRITADGYALELLRADDTAEPLTQWPGGAASMVPGEVGEAALELAIERSEDWLMPHSRALHGRVLTVQDTTGRVREGLQAVLDESGTTWDTPAFEGLFLRFVGLATGRLPAPTLQGRAAFAADMVLLRELAHHGQLAQLVLQD